MTKLIIAHALALSMFSSLIFAEGGGDRVIERNEARTQEALAAQPKNPDNVQNTVKSDTETSSASKS